jgi:Neuraminidase (sialidase)
MTTDSGTTWSPARIIYDPGQKNQTIDNQIVVEPTGAAAGTLVDGFVQILTKGGKGHNQRVTYNVAVIRSTDGGATWSAPVIVSQLTDAPVSIAGAGVRTGDVIPIFTADPATGNLYVVWQDGRFSPDGQAKIAFSMSSDGGLTWSRPIRVDQSPGDVPAFTPQVHVNADGTIGSPITTCRTPPPASRGSPTPTWSPVRRPPATAPAPPTGPPAAKPC